jgi:voltage-gated potassium channel
MSMILVIFASITMLHVETDPASNIKTPADALWWAFATITTVGYGDKYPITMGGRIVAIVLMVAGVALFATFTGYLSSFFLEPTQQAAGKELKQLSNEIRLLREKVESLERSISTDRR